MKKLTLLMLSFTMLSLTSFGQESTGSKTVFDTKLGLHAGTLSGVGFSFNTEINDKYSITATALPTGSKNDFTIISGIQLDYKIYNGNVVDFYWGINSSHYFSQYSWGDWGGGSGTSIDNVIGAGTAVKLQVSRPGKPLYWNVYFGYGVYDMLENYSFYPSIGTGLYYSISQLKK